VVVAGHLCLVDPPLSPFCFFFFLSFGRVFAVLVFYFIS
jgi:hypothetical protein